MVGCTEVLASRLGLRACRASEKNRAVWNSGGPSQTAPQRLDLAGVGDTQELLSRSFAAYIEDLDEHVGNEAEGGVG